MTVKKISRPAFHASGFTKGSWGFLEASAFVFVLRGATADRVSARLTLEAGDFFHDPLPAADAYLLMDLLHDWADADALRILEAVRRAAPARGRLLIIETLVPDEPGPHFGKTLDIIMLAVTGGRERRRILPPILAVPSLALLCLQPVHEQHRYGRDDEQQKIGHGRRVAHVEEVHPYLVRVDAQHFGHVGGTTASEDEYRI